MLFVSSTHCLVVLFLLFVVCGGVRSFAASRFYLSWLSAEGFVLSNRTNQV